jgi:hypothetical protein
LQRSDFKRLVLRTCGAPHEIPRSEKTTALKLCKQEQAVEESAVSRERDPIFHTLINTCVENLIMQK